jgi:hypothetical protein
VAHHLHFMQAGPDRQSGKPFAKHALDGKRMRYLLAAVILIAAESPCHGGFVINLGGSELSGSGAGDLAPSAVKLTFENLSELNGNSRVRLTIDAPDQTIPQWWWEKGKQIVFNSTHALKRIRHRSGVEAKETLYPNTKKFLGAEFNLKFLFSGRGETGAFFPGKTSQYILVGDGIGLDAATSFNVQRLTRAGTTTLGGIHILETFDEHGQPTGSGKYGSTDGGDGFTAVPEPSSIAFWMLCCGIGVFIRRRYPRTPMTPAV